MSKTRRLLVAALAVSLLVLPAPPAAAADAPIPDPIPDNPVPANFGLTLADFATFPKSEPVPPPTDQRLVRQARINYLGEVPDRSGRLFVPDLNGTLYFVRNGSAQSAGYASANPAPAGAGVPQPYLDVKAAVGADFWSGRGLGSGFGFVAFHPQFARNGKFYTVHTEAFGALQTRTPDLTPEPNTVVHGVITEWTATDPAANVFSGTRREVLRLGFAGYIHGIQQVDFNPNARPGDADYGLLYVAAGDGGIGVSTTIPQDLGLPQGKILRIDPAGTNGANGRYGVPAGNPFVGRPGALGEIYALGMRDPHRFSWDRGPGHRLFLGHIGEHAIEAVYDVRAGDNLGWSEREGRFTFNKADRCFLYPLPPNDPDFGYTYPVAAYDHDPPPGYPCGRDSGHAISGGFVYRGRDARLYGKYVFADIVDGRIFYTDANEMRRGGKPAQIHQLAVFDPTGRRVSMQDLAGDARVDLRLGLDRAGELFLLAKANGKIWRVTGSRWAEPNPDVFPTLRRNLVAFYDFEHAFPPDPTIELDQGSSHTNLNLVNGGKAMRVRDGAYPGSNAALQTQQVNPAMAGNDDWKAGTYSATGVPTLHAFNAVHGTTIMGWFKMIGQNPSPNSNSADPNDFFGAIGLAGLLSGDSDGHAVRALLELINVNGELRLVALGRRIDGSASQTFAANENWRTLLPDGEWVFLAATFDFDTGTMRLFRNGRAVSGFYVVAGDPWGVAEPGEHPTSATDPRGIKLGGSFPQNTREGNPCNCRMDSLMFLDRVVSPFEVWLQYHRVTGALIEH